MLNMAKRTSKPRHVYEVCMRRGTAEGCALVEAATESNAKQHALARAKRNEVAWEGRPRGAARVVSVEKQSDE
jgi:hypothetical protein